MNPHRWTFTSVKIRTLCYFHVQRYSVQNVTTFYCPKQLQSIHLNCLQCNSHIRIDTVSVQLVSVGLSWWKVYREKKSEEN